MENNNTLPYPFELKLEHQLEHKPEAKDFTIDVNAKIFRQGSSSSPLEDIFFSSTVDNFIWEDEDCPEKVALYELLVDSGIIEFEAQFLLIDIILYVSNKTQPLDEEFKGVFTLTVEVTLPPPESPEPVEINNRAGSEETQFQNPIATTKTREQLTCGIKPPPEPVEINHAGLEQTQFQNPIATTKTREQLTRGLKPKRKIQKAQYKIGPDGVSLVKVSPVE